MKYRHTFIEPALIRPRRSNWFHPFLTLVGIGLAGGLLVALILAPHFSPIKDDWRALERSWLTGKLVEKL